MYAFVLPVGTIVIINVFCMLVVVMKLLNPAMAEHSNRDEKQVSKGILKAVILLTPILGTTWFLGFFVLTIDLTKGPLAYFVNYAFTLLNGFQVITHTVLQLEYSLMYMMYAHCANLFVAS